MEKLTISYLHENAVKNQHRHEAEKFFLLDSHFGMDNTDRDIEFE